ncbi:alpha/beta hydrolase [Lentzea sp. HUAS12]|uniref:alpha/beta hydrolase family protein n=1 Tax=Lentzea sp. HUAS12 TaxID=2951806 RepID=UPI0020A151E9|nr:alpha/beta hydrolase [Lentzea sp. HUAS12]USX54889.1 alpha/beta hydrolase [Lentzea sp. HUAS12]
MKIRYRARVAAVCVGMLGVGVAPASAEIGATGSLAVSADAAGGSPTRFTDRSPAASAATAPAPTATGSPTTSIELTLPRPSGPFPVGTTELHLVDPTRADPWAPGRSRELMISLWYPALPSHRPPARHLSPGIAAFYDQTSAASVGLAPGVADFAGTATHAKVSPPLPGRRPVVLYSPGRGQSRSFGTTLVEDLASRGYVVVTIDHTFAGPVEFPDRVELPVRGADTALMMRERVRDTSFVLDRLAATGLDVSEVGMAGHSMGGFTAAEAMLSDRRIAAGANLDGGLDPRSGQASARGADRPFLLMGGGTSGADDLPHDHVHAPDWASFWANSTGWKRDVHLREAEHASFTDAQVLLPQINRKHPLPADRLAAAIGTIDAGRSLAAQREYVAAFFDLHLRGRSTTLFDGDSPAHPDARLVP